MKKYLVLLLFLLALPSFATEDFGYGILFEKEGDNLEINYLNRGCYDSVKKLYELREKSFNLKKYANGNMKNQI